MGVHTFDVAIIGAGPSGLFSVFELGMMGITTCVIDALPEIGGQCAALYPEKPIYDIPGFPHITGYDLIHNLSEQIKPFNPTYFLGQQVKTLQKEEATNSWSLETTLDQTISAKTVVIAAGAGAFGPNRPPIDGLEAFERLGSVLYSVTRKDRFKDKNLVIAGGGDSAVDWAITLADIAQKIYVIHRRTKFRAAPDSERKLRELADQGKVELVIPYQLSSVQGQDGHLTHVVVETLDGDKKALQADYLLLFFGLSMNLGPILEWGLSIEKHHIVIDPLTGRTSIDGIYAVGDIATYPCKLKLILTGFAEAAQVAHDIRSYLHPNESFHFEYSTTKGVPLVA